EGSRGNQRAQDERLCSEPSNQSGEEEGPDQEHGEEHYHKRLPQARRGLPARAGDFRPVYRCRPRPDAPPRHLMRGGAAVSPSRKVQVKCTDSPGSPESIRVTCSPAARPFATAGCATVVSFSEPRPSAAMPSKPTTVRSSGTFSPSS